MVSPVSELGRVSIAQDIPCGQLKPRDTVSFRFPAVYQLPLSESTERRCEVQMSSLPSGQVSVPVTTYLRKLKGRRSFGGFMVAVQLEFLISMDVKCDPSYLHIVSLDHIHTALTFSLSLSLPIPFLFPASSSFYFHVRFRVFLL